MKKLIITIIFIVFSSYTSAFGWHSNSKDRAEPQELALELYETCSQPTDLLSGAKSLLRKYLRGELLNSVLYDEFLWVHPEYVEFISCIICNSGIPNNRFWESEFDACNSDSNQSFDIMVEDTTATQTSKIL